MANQHLRLLSSVVGALQGLLYYYPAAVPARETGPPPSPSSTLPWRAAEGYCHERVADSACLPPALATKLVLARAPSAARRQRGGAACVQGLNMINLSAALFHLRPAAARRSRTTAAFSERCRRRIARAASAGIATLLPRTGPLRSSVFGYYKAAALARTVGRDQTAICCEAPRRFWASST